MSFARLLTLLAVFLFGGIFLLSLTKKKEKPQSVTQSLVEEVFLDDEANSHETLELAKKLPVDGAKETENATILNPKSDFSSLPQANRIDELFSVYGKKLDIVETISYTSRVSWLRGRPAWLSDYARHFQTPIHFISRSLSQSKDYSYDNVSNGDRFNIFSRDKKIEFHLVVDLSLLKMWMYAFNKESQEKILLKVYPVGLGRLDSQALSGSLTPKGVYSLGKKIATYREGVSGYFNHQKVEMIRIFGTRWIPFEQELKDCSAPAKGFGIHGMPWDESSGVLQENANSLGKYESDGCIRLLSQDVEELFAIITTKPSFIHLLDNFQDLEFNDISNQG